VTGADRRASRGAVEVTFRVDAADLRAKGGLDAAKVEEAARAALEEGGRAGAALSVVLVDDPTLARLHAEHLGDPSVTDVMSFDLGEDGGGPVGEVVVSVDRARDVAARRGVSFARELALYVVHGVLHLCGHDDGDDDERSAMRAAERRVLDRLGYEADDAPHELDGT
jgi:probable rRNA maturation factor